VATLCRDIAVVQAALMDRNCLGPRTPWKARLFALR
jgi:hypothetical protein